MDNSLDVSFTYSLQGSFDFDKEPINVNDATAIEQFTVMCWRVLNNYVKYPVDVIRRAVGMNQTLIRHVDLYLKCAAKLGKTDLFQETWAQIYQHHSAIQMKAYCLQEVNQLFLDGSMEKILCGVLITFIVLTMLQQKKRGYLCQALAKGTLNRLFTAQAHIPNLGDQLEAFFCNMEITGGAIQDLLIIDEDDLRNPNRDVRDANTVDTREVVEHQENCQCGALHSSYRIRIVCMEEKCMFIKLVVYRYFASLGIILQITNMPKFVSANPLFEQAILFESQLAAIKSSRTFESMLEARTKETEEKTLDLQANGSPAFQYLAALAYILHVAATFYPIGDRGQDFLSPMLEDFFEGMHIMEERDPTYVSYPFTASCISLMQEDVCTYLEQYELNHRLELDPSIHEASSVFAAVLYKHLIQSNIIIEEVTNLLELIKDNLTADQFNDLVNLAKDIRALPTAKTDLSNLVDDHVLHIKKFPGANEKGQIYWRSLRERTILEVTALCDRGSFKELCVGIIVASKMVHYMCYQQENSHAINLIRRLVHYINIVWHNRSLTKIDLLETATDHADVVSTLEVPDGTLCHIVYHCLVMLTKLDNESLNWIVPPKKSESMPWTLSIARQIVLKRDELFAQDYCQRVIENISANFEIIVLLTTEIQTSLNMHDLHRYYQTILILYTMNRKCIIRKEPQLGRRLVQNYLNILHGHEKYFSILGLDDEEIMIEALQNADFQPTLPEIQVKNEQLVQFVANCLRDQLQFSGKAEMRRIRFHLLHRDSIVAFQVQQFMQILTFIRVNEMYRRYVSYDTNWINGDYQQCSLERYLPMTVPPARAVLMSTVAFAEVLSVKAAEGNYRAIVAFTQHFLSYVDSCKTDPVNGDMFLCVVSSLKEMAAGAKELADFKRRQDEEEAKRKELTGPNNLKDIIKENKRKQKEREKERKKDKGKDKDDDRTSAKTKTEDDDELANTKNEKQSDDT